MPNINQYGYQQCSIFDFNFEDVIFNNLDDGTIEVFVDTNNGIGVPTYIQTPIGASCCEILNISNSGSPDYSPHPSTTGHTYTWDADRQECRWLQYADCNNLPPFNVVLNPQGNYGAIFEVQPEEICELNVEFDYMFKFDCQDIINVQLSGASPALTILYEELEVAMVDCISKQNDLDELNGGWNYVVPFINENGGTQYLCITEAGLPLLESLINDAWGATGWSDYLDGTINPHIIPDNPGPNNPNHVGTNMIIGNADNQGLYFTDCTETGFDLINDSIIWLDNYNSLTIQLDACTALIDNLNDQINTILVAEADNCIYAIDTFEELVVNMAIDLQDPNNPSVVDTIYTEEIFNVGAGNLVNYQIKNPANPIYLEGFDWITCDASACNGLANILAQQMIDQANENGLLSGTTFISQYNQLLSLTGNEAFAPTWFHYSGTISDPAIVSAMTNGYVNLSLQIVDSCVNFSILLDKIELNKNCERVVNDEIFVNKNPGFDIRKVCDNKKSWVYTEAEEARDYNYPMRNTDYDVNDSRLVLNTKEVDLNISIDNGIETDVWCYVNDNPCILEPCTNLTGFTATTCCCDPIPLSGTNITGGTVALPPTSAITPCNWVVGDVGPSGIGIVYWVNPNNPCEGYEITNSDIAIGVRWSDNLGWVGGTSTTFGSGQANTTLLVANSPLNYAAHMANNFISGIYSDWFLPSIDDLMVVRDNTNTLTLGNPEQAYWSSSEAGSLGAGFQAWGLLFNTTHTSMNTDEVRKNSDISPPITMYLRFARHFDTSICGDIYESLSNATLHERVTEEYTDCSWIYKFNSSFISTTFNGYWLAGMPDNTVGVFRHVTISGGTGTTIDYTPAISESCCNSLNELIQDFAWDTNKGEYYTEFKWDVNCQECKFVTCEKPECVDFTELLTSPVTGITTIKVFNDVISSELINVRCRKISSSYPTLRALYERYMNSTQYCDTQSSAFDYFTMSDFGNLVGTYWVDLFEQVVPSTTIWCANHIHGNTIYDQQKFKYRGHSLYPCGIDAISGAPVEAPIGFTWVASGAADVDIYTIKIDEVCAPVTHCNSGVYYVMGDCGSEFLGRVTITQGLSSS